jgi:hypothetical protein
MRGVRPLLALWALVAAGLGPATAPAFAATRLTEEPPPGQFRPGQRILVDDGSCPAGQIKQVVDVLSGRAAGGRAVAGVRRIRHCIRRQHAF